MNRTLIAGLMIVAWACSHESMHGSAPAPQPLLGEAGTSFLHQPWTPIATMSAMPREVIAALISRFCGDPRMADVGQPFDATDIVEGHPSRRFVLGGIAGRTCFVAYERGGIGHHIVLAMFDMSRHPPEVILLARGEAGHHNDVKGWGIDTAALRTALQQGRLRSDDPNEPGYY